MAEHNDEVSKLVPQQSVLRAEHELLGASFILDEGLFCEYVTTYGALADETVALKEGVGLCDLSGMRAWLVSGGDTGAFAQMACAQAPREVGSCCFSAVLTGEGALAAVPLVARTGNTECLFWDLSARAELLDMWLRFLVTIEQKGSRAFGEAELEDVSTALTPLLIAGPRAAEVLADYVVGHEVGLPQAGEVASLALDEIQCLVVGLPRELGVGWLVFVGTSYARVLWRSFLSFGQVVPVGWEALHRWAADQLPWWEKVATLEHETVALSELLDWGLADAQGAFVGGRALMAREDS